MSTKESPSGVDSKSTLLSTAEVPSLQREVVRATPDETVAIARAELERTFSLYRAGQFQTASSQLDKLERDLESIAGESGAAGNAPLASSELLRGQVWTLRGLTQRRVASDLAGTAFVRAVELFREWLPKSPQCSGREYRDLGIALYMTGSCPSAVSALKEAKARGEVTPELHLYLGLSLLEGMDRIEAEDNLRRAIELAPDDPLGHEALGALLERENRTAEALESHHRSAVLFADADRIPEALAAVDRALKLAPEDIRGLTLKSDLLRVLRRPMEALELADRVLAHEPTAVVLRTKGASLAALGRFDEAIEALDRALALEPGHIVALCVRGEVLRVLGRYDEAIDSLDNALALAPGDPPALASKGAALFALGRLDDALRALSQARDASPQNTFTLAYLGEVLRHQERYEDALQALDEALGAEPDDATTLGTKGQVLAALGRSDEAIVALERAVEVDPGVDWARADLGRLLAQTGRLEDALTTWNAFLARHPNDSAVLAHKGETLRQLGRFDEALEALDLALTYGPETSEARGTRGQVLRALGHSGEAIKDLERSVEIDGSMTWAYLELGETYREEGNFESAVQAFARAAKLNPDVDTLVAQGAMLRILGRHQEAMEVLDRALEIDRTDVGAIRNKAFALLGLRRFAEARAVLENADPTPTFRTDAAVVLQQAGSYDDALSALGQAEQLEPDNPWMLYVKGHLLCDVGEFRDGAEAFARVLSTDPNDTDSLAGMGWALENLGAERSAEARTTYERILTLDPDDQNARRGLANVLFAAGEIKAAEDHYNKVIADATARDDVDMFSVVGWCQCRLGHYDEALRALIEATSRNSELTELQFDIGLATLCSGNGELAIGEYRRALELLEKKHRLRQRGLLIVALVDVRDTVSANRLDSKEKNVRTVFEILEQALAATPQLTRERIDRDA
jgi:tetratricopeptide (TPR) repeat protein